MIIRVVHKQHQSTPRFEYTKCPEVSLKEDYGIAKFNSKTQKIDYPAAVPKNRFPLPVAARSRKGLMTIPRRERIGDDVGVVTRIPSERIGIHVRDMYVKTNAHTRMWSRVEIEKCFRFLVTL